MLSIKVTKTKITMSMMALVDSLAAATYVEGGTGTNRRVGGFGREKAGAKIAARTRSRGESLRLLIFNFMYDELGRWE